MEKTQHVLELLYDRPERYCALDELAAAAAVSKEQLSEILENLQEHGMATEFAPTYGVRLVRPVKLHSHLIERHLGVKRIGRSVICFDEVDSTNDVAMSSARRDDTDGLVVTAEYQRRGRGRQGGNWVSPPGANVLFSAVLLENPHNALSREALTVAAGLSVAEGIEDSCRLACQLKWPNDVLLDGGKVAGVLVETRRGGRNLIVVIGVGINVNASPPPEQVDLPATDLAARAGGDIERTRVVRSVLRRLDRRVEAVSAGRFDELHDAWLAHCGMLNTRVCVLCHGRRYTGRVLDVDPLSGLVLARDDGRNVHLPADGVAIVR